jgi:hypothetical protein
MTHVNFFDLGDRSDQEDVHLHDGATRREADAKRPFLESAEFNSRLFLEQLVYVDDLDDAEVQFLKPAVRLAMWLRVMTSQRPLSPGARIDGSGREYLVRVGGNQANQLNCDPGFDGATIAARLRRRIRSCTRSLFFGFRSPTSTTRRSVDDIPLNSRADTPCSPEEPVSGGCLYLDQARSRMNWAWPRHPATMIAVGTRCQTGGCPG